jgi:hypothetical protein
MLKKYKEDFINNLEEEDEDELEKMIEEDNNYSLKMKDFNSLNE